MLGKHVPANCYKVALVQLHPFSFKRSVHEWRYCMCTDSAGQKIADMTLPDDQLRTDDKSVPEHVAWCMHKSLCQYAF